MAEISGSLRSRDAKSILWAGLFDVLYIHLNSFWARLHPYLLYNCTTHVLQSSTGVKVVKVVMLPPPLQFLFWLWTKLLRIPGVGTSHDGTSAAQIIGPKISQNLTVNRVNRVNRVNNIESSYIPNGRGSYPGFWHKNLRKGESDQKAGGSVFSPRPMYEYVYTYIYIICIYIYVCDIYIYYVYVLFTYMMYIIDYHLRDSSHLKHTSHDSTASEAPLLVREVAHFALIPGFATNLCRRSRLREFPKIRLNCR